MPLCKQCQILGDHILHAKHISSWSGDVILHASYAELSACAESFCDLCMFFLRECWYYFQCMGKDLSQDVADATGGSVTISPYYYYRQSWVLNLGREMGPTLGFVIGPFQGRPKTTRKLGEIREADPSLEWSLGKCKKWLSDCLNHHQGCGRRGTDKSGFLPTRLLEVGPQQHQTIRLVLSKDLDESVEVTYVTLSYCWGATNDTARTTKENLNDRLEGIQVESLPQTLQDAIAVTRGLGIRYLWIDALCIIQGGMSKNNDWEKELPNMGRVYGHSLLTIAASSASSSEAGFLRRKNGGRWPVRNLHLSDSRATGTVRNALTLEAHPPRWYEFNIGLPLSKRGWVLQERMLASRTLSWTDHGIFWSCGDKDASEYEDSVELSPTTRLHDVCEEVKKIRDRKQVICTNRFTFEIWKKLLFRRFLRWLSLSKTMVRTR